MKLAEMCRKLETEEEKVLPFYASSLTPEEEYVVSTHAEEPCSEELAEVRIFLEIFFCYSVASKKYLCMTSLTIKLCLPSCQKFLKCFYSNENMAMISSV